MSRLVFSVKTHLVCALLLVMIGVSPAFAQSSGFTYQGRLTDGGTAANGNYDLQFALWDSLSGGAQIGSTQTVNSVAVSNGVFSVALDFGVNSFPGANRFLEISARPSGAGSFTLLTPRQQIGSTPYAVRSVSAGNADTAISAATATNATQLGGVAASQYVQTSDSRLNDARTPTPGSSNYIQNTNSQQSGTNFNISGNGTVGGIVSGNVVNAGTQFNIGGTRILTVNGANGTNSNIVAGVGAGASLTPNNNNGIFNSFFGFNAGNQTTTGGLNAFFGSGAGQSNTLGSSNSFFGNAAGINAATGAHNSFFGDSAGAFNQGGDNSYFGAETGLSNSTGNNNSFFGSGAGSSVHNGSNNTLIGARAEADENLTNATAIGANAVVQASNSLVLGSITGLGQATSDTNVGIGTALPSKRLDVHASTAGDGISLSGSGPGYFLNAGNLAAEAALGFAGSAGFYSSSALQGDIVLRNLGGRVLLQHGAGGAALIVNSTGTVAIPTLGSAGGTSLCRNSANEISTCSSSLRYKTNVLPFLGGLEIINRLRPIRFTWKQDGTKDIGFGAEEVEKVAPLFTFKNDKGEIEGVRYDRLGVIFVNAFKEQQAQIEKQQEQINKDQAQIKQAQSALIEQRSELEALRKLVCRSHRRSGLCK